MTDITVEDISLVAAVIVGLGLMAGVIVRDTRRRVANLWSGGLMGPAPRSPLRG